MSLQELWKSIEADLVRARETLPQSAEDSDAIRQYQEYIDHNELELACDMLASYGRDHLIDKEFWRALSDAASKMKLPTQASLYKEYCESS